MIFDRTQQDVDLALYLRQNKVQKFQELTESDIEVLERGFMTANTLNRIEQKQVELKSILSQMGYWNVPIQNKTWDTAQIFNVEDFKRIIENLRILKEAFFTYKETPQNPRSRYHYENINAIEKILHDIEIMTNEIKSNYVFCGKFNCGEAI